jgi:hypothetical protein
MSCQALEDEHDRCKCRTLAEFCSKSLPCPDCGACGCEEHCVILGKIELDANGCLVSVCINDCRTYVLSGRMLQYLTRSVFAGVENWATMTDTGDELPPVSRLVENPIYGLCWLIRHFMLEGNQWTELVPPWILNDDRTTWTDEGDKCRGEREWVEEEEEEEEPIELQVAQLEQRFASAEELENRFARVTEVERELADVKKQLSALKGQFTRMKQQSPE